MKNLTFALITKIFAVIAAFLAPIYGVLLVVGMFIGLDTIVGVWKAYKTKQAVRSRKMARVVNKMLVYNLTVITFFALDLFIFGDIVKSFISFDFALTKVVALILVSIEAYSIDESFKEATGKGLLERFTKLVQKYKEVKEEVKENLPGSES